MNIRKELDKRRKELAKIRKHQKAKEKELKIIKIKIWLPAKNIKPNQKLKVLVFKRDITEVVAYKTIETIIKLEENDKQN